MPKGHHSQRSQPSNYYPVSISNMPGVVAIAPQQYTPISARPDHSIPNPYYPGLGIPTNQPYPSPSYPTGGPVQQPLLTPQYAPHSQSLLPREPQPSSGSMASIRASSGAWTPNDDNILMQARAKGMNWAPIQMEHFPNKTPNACRKRHERLMERRNADDWDGIKLETLAKTYMAMRKEIWSALAAETGEKWNVVEQKCMAQGLKNLQASARAHARRERLDGYASHTDDSAIGMEDLDVVIDVEADYDADGASNSTHSHGHSGRRSGHSHNLSYHSQSSDGSNGGYGNGMEPLDTGRVSVRYMSQQAPMYQPQRLPSMDMGINTIINPTSGHVRGHPHSHQGQMRLQGR